MGGCWLLAGCWPRRPLGGAWRSWRRSDRSSPCHRLLMAAAAQAGTLFDALVYARLSEIRVASRKHRTSKRMDASDPDIILVITLARCARVSRCWRQAAMCRLVRVLSPPFSSWGRAAAARALIPWTHSQWAEELVEANVVPALLALAQKPRRQKDFKPDQAASPAVLEMGDSGFLALGALAGVAEERLAKAGWTVHDSSEEDYKNIPPGQVRR